MKHLKGFEKVDELFGIRNAIRSMKHEDEMDMIEILYDIKKASNLKREEKKGAHKQNIISYTFDFDFLEYVRKNVWKTITKSVRVERENYTKIVTPTLCDYNIYIDNWKMDCSMKTSGDIFSAVSDLYKSSAK